MKSRLKASFIPATLHKFNGNEVWLIPARSRAAAENIPIPFGCEISFGSLVWLELQSFYDGDNGYTFVFYYNNQYWHIDNNFFGYDYLYERYIEVINQYNKAQLEQYQ